MNNKELFQFFTSIQNTAENVFDVALALKRARPQYKKSIFYKETHLSIQDAYRIFMMRGLDKILTFLTKEAVAATLKGDLSFLKAEIEYFFDTLDPAIFSNLITAMEDKIKSFDLTKVQTEFRDAMETLNIPAFAD